jgi:hypothetical protein
MHHARYPREAEAGSSLITKQLHIIPINTAALSGVDLSYSQLTDEGSG